MTYRTTFALDQETATRLKRLAARWHVSQAEVVRRAVQQADEACPEKKAPLEVLKAYHAKGGLNRGQAEAYLAKVNEDRKQWRSE